MQLQRVLLAPFIQAGTAYLVRRMVLYRTDTAAHRFSTTLKGIHGLQDRC